MDVHSVDQRSFNMSKIRGKDTRPELLVRKWLWENGYKYRLHKKELPGRPDIVLTKYSAVIFIHGCFWHRHGCRFTTTPESRQNFWLAKFDKNINRDKQNITSLLEQSWRIMVIWECSLRRKRLLPNLVAEQIVDFLNSETRFIEIGMKKER